MVPPFAPLPVERPPGPGLRPRTARIALRLAAVCLALAAPLFAAASARAEDGTAAAPSTAENDLFRRIQNRLFRDLPPALTEDNAILNPDNPLSQNKAQRSPAALPTVSVQGSVLGRFPVPGGVLLVPVPAGAEELPGAAAAVWYNDHLRIRVDSMLPDLVRPFDWREALPREYHIASPTQPTVTERLAESVKLKFDEVNAGDHFAAWLEVCQTDAADLARPRLSFADRVAILYRLYKKALAPKDMKHYANGQLRCLVSLPAAEEQIHRRTGEKENRWNAAALLAPTEGGPLVRITFSEPDHEKRQLTETLVLNALANCRWETAP